MTVGDVTLNAGEFLYSDNNYTAQIRHFAPTGVGLGTTTGTKQIFLNATGNFNIVEDISGLELIEVDTTIGGETLLAGTLLAASAEPDSVGDTPTLSVDDSDFFKLTVSKTIMGSATSEAVATMFMDGSAVYLDAGAEDIVALTLVDQPPVSNQPPTTVDTTVTTDEDATYMFELADFNYADADGDPLDHIQITALETVGSLELSGTPVTLNQTITKVQIDAGSLKFVPVADESGTGYDSFQFRVHDGTTYSVEASTISILNATFVTSQGLSWLPTSTKLNRSFPTNNWNSWLEDRRWFGSYALAARILISMSKICSHVPPMMKGWIKPGMPLSD